MSTNCRCLQEKKCDSRNLFFRKKFRRSIFPPKILHIFSLFFALAAFCRRLWYGKWAILNEISHMAAKKKRFRYTCIYIHTYVHGILCYMHAFIHVHMYWFFLHVCICVRKNLNFNWSVSMRCSPKLWQ